jgi:hypothetical protein
MEKIKRKPAKIKKKKASSYQILDPLVSPQHRIKDDFNYNDLPKDVTNDQVLALQEKNFALWVCTSGLKVDHNDFSFDDHKYMIPLYMDTSKEIILQKAAQMGATIYELTELLHFAMFNEAVKTCLFFPTGDGIIKLSRDRMTPLLASNKQLSEAVEDTDTLGYKKIGKSSALYLQHLGGIASKDSTPFDMISFDEVRLLKAADIDQARERISHSTHKIVRMVSTAGMPNGDINRQFLRGTQNYWHSRCGCRDGIELSSVFPQCIVEHKNETYYRCPRCDYRINDPQNGEFISHKPGASVQSYHIHQMLSKFMTPAEILESFRTTQNIKEFWNAKLGRAYVDEENVPLTQDDLDAAVNTDCSWGKDEGQIAMGVDQMGGDNYIVISKRLRDGEKRIIHLEIIDDENPRYYKNGKQDSSMIFKRTAELMTEFKVDLCICDALPNYNDAKEFAQAFPKKVFLAYYIEQQRDMVQWGDRGQFKQQVKKGSHKIKFKQTVCLSRYLSIEFAMKEISNGNFQWPHPRTLVQIAKIEGKLQPTMLMEEVFYEHCKGIVRNKEIVDEATGAFKMSWVNLGGDPHFVHALNYNNIALERLKSVPIFCIG